MLDAIVTTDELTVEQQENQNMQQVFAALNNSTRIAILKHLIEQERDVTTLTALASASQSQVSHQLRILRDKGMVHFRRSGNRVLYRVASEDVKRLVKAAQEFVN